MSNTNTSAAKVAATGKVKIIDNWNALNSAVVEQLGGKAQHDEDVRRVVVSENEAEELENVGRSSCGAAGGFNGFIYYSETWQFFRANRAAIVAALQEMAEGIGEGCAVDLVRGFNCFVDDKPSADDVGRVLWGELPERWENHRNERGEWVGDEDYDPYAIANACAFFALEETANKWIDGQEVGEEEGARND